MELNLTKFNKKKAEGKGMTTRFIFWF